ncbi:MAG: hypothetical protein ACPGUV_14510, partial [Polyangiales bacterium]
MGSSHKVHHSGPKPAMAALRLSGWQRRLARPRRVGFSRTPPGTPGGLWRVLGATLGGLWRVLGATLGSSWCVLGVALGSFWLALGVLGVVRPAQAEDALLAARLHARGLATMQAGYVGLAVADLRAAHRLAPDNCAITASWLKMCNQTQAACSESAMARSMTHCAHSAAVRLWRAERLVR